MPKYRLAKRPDSPRWYVVWTEGRRSRRVPTGTEDERQAELILQAFSLEQAKPKEVAPAGLAIADVLRWYYDAHASKRPSAEQADIAIRHLNRFYGASRVSAINSATHTDYERQRRTAGVGWQTINRERMVLRAALRYAGKHHGLTAVPHVPAIAEDHPENAPVEPKGRPLTLEELARLIQAAKSPHMRRFVLILMGTMCRPAAARDMTARQLDFEHGLIDLNPKGRRQTKKYRPIVPMTDFLRRELKGAKGYVLQYHGEPIASTKTAWRAMRTDAKLDAEVNPYSIRHTMARELRRRKVPGDQVAIMLGHRPVGTSRTDLVYAPYEPGYCEDAAKALDAVYREVARQWRAKRGAGKLVEKAGKPFKMRGGRARD